MKINELISILEKVQNEYGNIVVSFSEGDDEECIDLPLNISVFLNGIYLNGERYNKELMEQFIIIKKDIIYNNQYEDRDGKPDFFELQFLFSEKEK